MSKTIVTEIFAYKCPNCGAELSLNRDMYAKEIAQLKNEVTSIDAQMVLRGKEDIAWWKRANTARTHKIRRITELRQMQKDLHDLQDAETDMVFRKKVKALLGEEAYVKLREESAYETLASYKVETVEGE